MAKGQDGNFAKMGLVCAAVAAWLIYGMATATETPRQAVAILQYFLLACALFGVLGALVKGMSVK